MNESDILRGLNMPPIVETRRLRVPVNECLRFEAGLIREVITRGDMDENSERRLAAIATRLEEIADAAVCTVDAPRVTAVRSVPIRHGHPPMLRVVT